MSSEPTRIDFPSGSTTIAAYRWDPDGEPRAIVQLTHGMGEHALRYAHLAQALNAQGYVVYAHDQRGHGATAASRDGLGRLGEGGWQELLGDIDRMRARAREEYPTIPLVLLGHSMGSFAVQQYLLDHSEDVDAVVLTGTALIHLLEPVIDLDQPIDLSVFNAAFEPARTEYDWLSRDEAQVDAYVADPYCGFGLDQAGGKEMFEGALRINNTAVVHNIRVMLPVYIAVGDKDPVNGELTLVKALVDLLEEVGLTNVTFRSYPGARHEILNETNRDEVYADLVRWLDGAIS